MYQVILLSPARKDLKSLDRKVARRIIEKIKWLAQHADLLGRQPIKGMPEELTGLNKYRVGDYRVFYVVNKADEILKIYGVKHRSKAYR